MYLSLHVNHHGLCKNKTNNKWERKACLLERGRGGGVERRWIMIAARPGREGRRGQTERGNEGKKERRKRDRRGRKKRAGGKRKGKVEEEKEKDGGGVDQDKRRKISQERGEGK